MGIGDARTNRFDHGSREHIIVSAEGRDLITKRQKPAWMLRQLMAVDNRRGRDHNVVESLFLRDWRRFRWMHANCLVHSDWPQSASLTDRFVADPIRTDQPIIEPAHSLMRLVPKP